MAGHIDGSVLLCSAETSTCPLVPGTSLLIFKPHRNTATQIPLKASGIQAAELLISVEKATLYSLAASRAKSGESKPTEDENFCCLW